jgi:hypothetical protein
MTLYLRNDVPGPYAKGLEQLRLPELETFLARFDSDLSSTAGSGVWNWFDFERRMGWLVELFRTQANNPAIVS